MVDDRHVQRVRIQILDPEPEVVVAALLVDEPIAVIVDAVTGVVDDVQRRARGAALGAELGVAEAVTTTLAHATRRDVHKVLVQVTVAVVVYAIAAGVVGGQPLIGDADGRTALTSAGHRARAQSAGLSEEVFVFFAVAVLIDPVAGRVIGQLGGSGNARDLGAVLAAARRAADSLSTGLRDEGLIDLTITVVIDAVADAVVADGSTGRTRDDLAVLARALGGTGALATALGDVVLVRVLVTVVVATVAAIIDAGVNVVGRVVAVRAETARTFAVTVAVGVVTGGRRVASD